MLITDPKILMRTAKAHSGRKWREVADDLGRYKANIIATAYRGKALIESFENILDALGYDIRITIIKKGQKAHKKGE